MAAGQALTSTLQRGLSGLCARTRDHHMMLCIMAAGLCPDDSTHSAVHLRSGGRMPSRGEEGWEVRVALGQGEWTAGEQAGRQADRDGSVRATWVVRGEWRCGCWWRITSLAQKGSHRDEEVEGPGRRAARARRERRGLWGHGVWRGGGWHALSDGVGHVAPTDGLLRGGCRLLRGGGSPTHKPLLRLPQTTSSTLESL